MRETTSQIPSDHVGSGDRLQRHVALSLTAHFLALAVLLFGPTGWTARSDDRAFNVMSIRLGGPEGPGQGGQTPLGSLPIQEVITMPEARRPRWVQPPAVTAPEVVVTTREVSAPRLEPASEVETAPEEARGRQLTKGPLLQDGTAMADTGADGMGVGLSGGGLGGASGEIRLADFCCPEYVATMMSLIQQRWDRRQGVTGRSVVRFTIVRDGLIEDVGVAQSSGYATLDRSARRAVLLTGQLPPLPSAYTGSNLRVNLSFRY